MTPTEFLTIQQSLGLSDRKLAVALGVTRQTVRNWRCWTCFPTFAQHAITWMLELRRLDPANDNLPPQIRQSN